MMDEKSHEKWDAEVAVRNLVQNLLRCLSGGQAGSWPDVMRDIYKAAIADQVLRQKDARGLTSEAVQNILDWRVEHRQDEGGLAPLVQYRQKADEHLQNAYGSALRVVAYRISGTIKVQASRAENDFDDHVRYRESALFEARAAYAPQIRVPKRSPKRRTSD